MGERQMERRFVDRDLRSGPNCAHLHELAEDYVQTYAGDWEVVHDLRAELDEEGRLCIPSARKALNIARQDPYYHRHSEVHERLQRVSRFPSRPKPPSKPQKVSYIRPWSVEVNHKLHYGFVVPTCGKAHVIVSSKLCWVFPGLRFIYSRTPHLTVTSLCGHKYTLTNRDKTARMFKTYEEARSYSRYDNPCVCCDQGRTV